MDHPWKRKPLNLPFWSILIHIPFSHNPCVARVTWSFQPICRAWNVTRTWRTAMIYGPNWLQRTWTRVWLACRPFWKIPGGLLVLGDGDGTWRTCTGLFLKNKWWFIMAINRLHRVPKWYRFVFPRSVFIVWDGPMFRDAANPETCI